MLKLLSLSAVAAVAFAGAAFAADSSATPPMAKGGMFVDTKGMTLYTYDKDTAGQAATCADKCAAAWPPAFASAAGLLLEGRGVAGQTHLLRSGGGVSAA